MDNLKRFCLCGCGREVVRPVHKYRKGHKSGNMGSAMIPVNTNCGFCKKAIAVPKYRMDKFANVYCSRRCSAKHRTGRTIVTLRCEGCSKDFQTKPCRKQGEHIFCSPKCFYDFKVASNVIKHQPNVQCSHCKKSFYVYPSKLKKNDRFYCNTECRANFIKGSNNPAFIDGSSVGRGRNGEYGPNWRRQVRKAKIRDGKRCAVCHAQSSKPKFLHVHHIVEILEFNEDFEAGNALENLITLCETCHHRLHRGNIALLP